MNVIFMFSPIIFLIPLMLGTFLVLSSSSWFSLWLGMELNVISFIPMILSDSSSSAESAISYFLIQAFSSLLFISVIFMTTIFSLFIVNSIFIMIVMMLKMGSAPFHSWVLFMVKSLTWPKMILLLIWQKINPLFLLNLFNSNLFSFIVLNAVIGAFTGLSQFSFRKMMVLSSLVHLSWIFLAMQYSHMNWILYFMGYSINLLILMFLFYYFNLNYVKDIFKIKNNNFQSAMVCFYIFNMAGLPPFTGFFLKWMVLSFSIEKNIFLSFIVLMMSLLSLVFYIRIIYNSMLLSKVSITLMFNYKLTFYVFPIFIIGPMFISLI
uniref:NADH-ubiquinone oxidoreductase chain 2 n=1 Tax=Argulus americanus TaxID=260819 RepID=Q6SL25_9CRUS|nr:NADH dehydrogenase subunit 2 [Argulus americanus]AAS00848.1 NADH dehydrogenase subunit 2 [Argulus americanus]